MARRGRGLGIAALVVGLLGLMPAIGTFVYGRSAYGVGTQPSGSMAPTYKAGERIVWEQVDGSEVRRGDVVLFSAPDRYGAEGVHMQRVIGVGGDRVACCTLVGSQERVTVNGKPIKEPYVSGGDADGGHGQYDVKVAQGRLFLLGDHRADAMDSRFFAKDHGGTVPVDAVRGRMTDNRTILVLLGSALLLGAVLFLTGIGLGIGFLVVRRRKAPPVPPAPWPTQPVQV
ncbi:signal peptidase I [Streptomyces sp. NBC_00201]|uniref:signal peptidase I n=1 Tax=unclassified Streptomyces TaxID=2593676 RepID=UPI0022578CA7|nr:MULTISPECIES: signal peptidase I [unclassified Streptomyces]MCX5246428.1 signal peptidase I [Streptomyces sp. NBC_00201]